jgi:acetyl esterase/lipase
LSIFRISFAGDTVAEKFLNQPRFAAVKSNLYQRVERPSFTGYWIFRHSFTDPQPPSSSDIVLCYIHGGGYVVWQPGTYISLMLAVVEAVMKRGFTISVFALDYSLAPEAAFPTQLGEMAAMYAYLNKEMHVDYQKIALMGDSAGAHLVLSFLSHLDHPTSSLSPNPSDGLPKPGAGVFLTSPWVTFDTTDETYKTNDGIDMVNKSVVGGLARIYLTGSKEAGTDEVKPYREFLHPVTGGREWAQILPKKVYVSAGRNEVLVGVIEKTVEAMGEAGVSVQFSCPEGKAHDWQFTDCLRAEKSWLQTPLEKEVSVKLDGVEELAEALVRVSPGS